jgi:O-antigen ligase
MIIIPTIALLVFALVCFKNIRYGVYAVIFSMPFYLLRFSIFGIPTTILEMMIYTLFLVWIFRKILKQYHSIYYDTVCLGGIKKNKNKILLIGIALLFLGVLISTFNSSDLKNSLGIFKGWFVDPFLFFVVFISVIKKEKHLILSLKSWLFSGIAVSLISIFYLLNNNLTFDGRLKAFFLSPNHLAMYLAPAFLIGLFFLLNDLSFPRRRESIATINNSFVVVQNIKKILNIKYLIFLIIILIPLYFTYSYGAFLGIFAAIIWLFFKTNNLSFLRKQESTATINFKKHSFLKITASIILISFIIFISLGKFDQIISSSERSSFHSRLMIWNTAGEIIKDNLLFGIGPGTFQEIYLSYSNKFSEPYLEWAVPQPHNIFLAFYLQTGFIGFIGFVLILFWFFSSKLKYSNILISNILTILMIYILVHGFVDTTYWKNDLSLMFWLIIGMKAVLRK